MYIYPNTTLHILKNVSLNSDYDHTVYFEGKVEQTEYFLSKIKYTLSNQSYQRKERGWIQVNINQNDLWDCTYLMYQNTTHHNKWFYAFILNVEYINEGVSKINFEIDVIQTWHFDYVLDKCFVEREHSITDNYFENTIEENLDLGSGYWVNKNYEYNLDSTRVAVVESSRFDPTVEGGSVISYTPTIMANYFTGLHYQSYDLKNLDTTDPNYPHSSEILKAHIQDFVTHGIPDSIVSIYQYPRFMGYIPNTTQDSPFNYASDYINFNPVLTTFGSYEPKNKKLFTFPYTFIELDDMQGNTAEYKLEYWYPQGHVGEFRITGTPFGIPSCLCFPRYYNGETDNFQGGMNVQINVQSPWVGDAYQVWLARNEKNLNLRRNIGIAQLGLGAIIAGASSIAGNPNTNLMGSGLNTLVDAIATKIERKNELEMVPGTVYGQTADTLLNLQMGTDSIIFRQKSIRQEYAMIIDEYFSRFGYACHRVKVPNRNARLNWTYTKTVGCEITGNIPSDDCVKIKAIYDHGITFWKNKNNLVIGDYGDFTNPVYSS